MAKIYLAARWTRLNEMSVYADLLKSDGHEITASWVYGGEEGKTRAEIAALDFDDVNQADTFIGFHEPKGTAVSGGGRHTEFGFAYVLGHRCLMVHNLMRGNDYEQIFHYLPKLEHYTSFKQAREALNG